MKELSLQPFAEGFSFVNQFCDEATSYPTHQEEEEHKQFASVHGLGVHSEMVLERDGRCSQLQAIIPTL